MKININNKEVEVKGVSCSLNGEKGYSLKDCVTTNLYTCVTHECNASCKFCEYCYSDIVKFDMDKWKYSVDKIIESLPIYKASFTGGEPSLKLDIVQECISYLKSKDKNIFTVMNTNGVNLRQLEDIEGLNNIALSRHSISDIDNNKIFGIKVATLEDISNFKYKDKLHLSCNLIKGQIDSQDKLEKYMDMASSVGVTDVGFVSLMPINDYAKEKGIDFMDISLQRTKKFNEYQTFRKFNDGRCVCKCRNYMYLAENMDIVWAYSRFYVDNSCTDGGLVFMDNHLREGFVGNIIV